jgi:prepilin-type N-terminal cleavage/methylation domain-containing protein
MRDRGFALLEVLIAAALLVTLAAGMSRILALGMREVQSSRLRAVATIVAAGKLEELRSTPAGEGSGGGVDYLDAAGETISTGTPVPASAVYIRRWTVDPLAADSDLFALQVEVATRDGVLMARLITIRAPR